MPAAHLDQRPNETRQILIFTLRVGVNIYKHIDKYIYIVVIYFIIVNSRETIKEILFNPMYTCLYRFDPVRGHKLCISNFWNGEKQFIEKNVSCSQTQKYYVCIIIKFA